MKANNLWCCLIATSRRSSSYAHKFSIAHHNVHLLRKTRSLNFSISLTNARNIRSTNSSLIEESNSGDLPKLSTNIPQESVVWTIPNILCGLRIIAAPILGYCIVHQYYFPSIGILTVAGLTDLVDGYIARNFEGQSSRLGTFLDPLADKILIITLYSSLVHVELIPSLLMEIIVLRDVLLLLAGIYIRYLSIPPPRTVKKYFDTSFSQAELRPTYLSKVNTVLQITIAVVSLYAPTTTWITRDTLSLMWYTAGFSTVISGLSYIFSKNTFVILKNSSRKSY